MPYRGPMHIHRSNRVESLLTGLARLVARPLSDPLKAECIVVRGGGMERWLSLELSSRLGVFARSHFPFPRAFLGIVRLARSLQLPITLHSQS